MDRAIREGITRNQKTNQGNGLFGSFEICRVSGGVFNIYTGNAHLIWNAKQQLHINNSVIPFAGTMVVSRINLSTPDILRQALKFGGKSHTPTDFIETKYETENDNVVIIMSNETESFGSRISATPVYNRMLNIINVSICNKVIVDFSNVPIISSSFADEVFGKLFLFLGPMTFMKKYLLQMQMKSFQD